LIGGWKETKIDEWQGSATEWLAEFAQDDGAFRTLTAINCAKVVPLGRALAELARRYPDRVFNTGSEYHARYRFLTEAKAKEVGQAVVKAAGSIDNVVVAARFQE
jgi:hypothetical protein